MSDPTELNEYKELVNKDSEINDHLVAEIVTICTLVSEEEVQKFYDYMNEELSQEQRDSIKNSIHSESVEAIYGKLLIAMIDEAEESELEDLDPEVMHLKKIIEKKMEELGLAKTKD